MIKIIWKSDTLEVITDSNGELLFAESPMISNDFIRVQPEELTLLSIHWLQKKGYEVNLRIYPCPICGGTNLKIDEDDGWYSVSCENCEITTREKYYREQAINEWNRLPRNRK